ncbi:hypothetical protein PLESTB_000509700 [Pleodorina starrii]|uniref:Uncharacterized protein n=1 Tax=Pleodorina starrii TaxID=330485 RepID=A0A9W6BGS9_9CHLO|nr:hypothetical protein PLESTB_000509700 [Pleodorina starrii]
MREQGIVPTSVAKSPAQHHSKRVKPAPEALVNVHAPNGSLHRIPLRPGLAGRRRFLRAVRQALCLPAHAQLEMSFEVAVPSVEGCSRPTLINTRDFSLASHIATVNAGVRRAKGGGGAGAPEGASSPRVREQQQHQHQQEHQQEQQQQPQALAQEVPGEVVEERAPAAEEREEERDQADGGRAPACRREATAAAAGSSRRQLMKRARR